MKPIVAIVGRPNVGNQLFLIVLLEENCHCRRYSRVTDRLYRDAEWKM